MHPADSTDLAAPASAPPIAGQPASPAAQAEPQRQSTRIFPQSEPVSEEAKKDTKWRGRFGKSAATAGLSFFEAIGTGIIRLLWLALLFALEVARRALLSWGVFEAAKILLPHGFFMGAHAILIFGALMIVGGAIGFALCLPWAAIQTFAEWGNPVERAHRAAWRLFEWGRFVMAWLIWCAPWALSAWTFSLPWQGHWAELAAQLARMLKIG